MQFKWLHSFLMFIYAKEAIATLVHVQSFDGSIGAENFTYFKVALEDDVTIKLQSYEGDADLYVSTETLKPSWDDYTMKSDTCSEDIVVVRKFLQRPIGIGVYGYIQFQTSKYRLTVYVDSSNENYYPDFDDNSATRPPLSNIKTTLSPDIEVEEDEESLLWTLFIGFLKVLVEILI